MKKIFFAFLIFMVTSICYAEVPELVIQKRHSTMIMSITYSPDGKYVASSGYGVIELWQARTGRLVRMFEQHDELVISADFSPDGKYLASSSGDKIRLWEVGTGKFIRTLEGHSDTVKSVAFSPDGKYVASGSYDKTIRLWETNTGELIRIFKGVGNLVVSVAFSPDGKYLAGSSSDRIRLWETGTGKLIRTLEGHTTWVNSINFSPDGKYLASGSSDKTIKLWEAETGELIRTLEGHSGWIKSVAFSPDGKYLASGSYDKTIRLWETNTGKLIRILKEAGDMIGSVVFEPDGKYIASNSLDGRIRFWEAGTGKLIRTIEASNEMIFSVAFSPDGKYIASSSFDVRKKSDSSIKLWETETGELVRTIEEFDKIIFSVAFSPDRKFLAFGSADKTIKLWEINTGKLIKTLGEHNEAVSSITFSPDGKYLASGSFDKTIKLWKITTGKLVRTLEGHSGWINSVAFSPDGKYLASAGSNDPIIRLWEVKTGKPVRTFEGEDTNKAKETVMEVDEGTGEVKIFESHIWRVSSAVFSPDGKYLAAGSGNKIRLWEAGTGKLIRTFEGHSDTVNSVRFSLDGECLASASSDATIKLWEIDTGKLTKTLEGHGGGISSIVFSPGGKYLASGSNDTTVKLWDVKTGKLMVTMLATKEGEWITYTPENFYNSSENGAKFVAFRIGNEVYSFDQYESIYKKPEIIRAVLGGMMKGAAMTISPGKIICQYLQTQEKVVLRNYVDGELKEEVVGGEMKVFSVDKGLIFEKKFGDDEKVVWDVSNIAGRRYRIIFKSISGKKFKTKFILDRDEGGRPSPEYESMLGIRTSPKYDELIGGTPSPKEEIPFYFPPYLVIRYPDDGQKFEEARIPLKIEAGERETGIKSIWVEANGEVLEGSDKKYGKDIKRIGKKKVRQEYPIELNYGENIIKVCAYSTKLVRSDIEELAVHRTAMKRQLWLLAIGINKYKNPNYRLRYARPDAEEIAKLFKKQEGLLYEKVNVEVLVDNAAVRENIINARYEFLDNASAVDTVAIFLSGHGVKDSKGNYYFLTYDADMIKPALRGLSYGDIKQTLLAGLPTKNVLFLSDSCHSGTIAKGTEQYNEIQGMMENIAKEINTIIISAATEKGFAAEHRTWGHGAFTYAMEKGLKGEADSNNDKSISARELYFYVSREVINLTDKLQHPTGPDPEKIGLGDFTIYLLRGKEE